MILGGGIAGLYAAYQLVKRDPARELIVLERDKWGGNIFTYKDAYMVVEAGGARFGRHHELLMDLLREFKLDEKIVPVSESEYVHSSPYTLKMVLGKVYLASKVDLIHDLKKMSLMEYIKTVVSEEEARFVEDSLGYSNMFHTNAYNALHALSEMNHSFFILQGGLSQVIHELMRRLSLYRVSLRKEEVVAMGKTIRTNRGEYSPPFCICTLPPHVIASFTLFSKLDVRAIECAPLCRIYCTLPAHDIPKVRTSSPLRMILPMGDTVMIYTDGDYARYWNRLYLEKGSRGVNRAIREYMYQDLGLRVEPVHTKVFYWECGVGYWRVGKDSEVLSKQFQNPCKGVYLCGSQYSSTYQQWIEGALQTSRAVVEKINAGYERSWTEWITG